MRRIIFSLVFVFMIECMCGCSSEESKELIIDTKYYTIQMPVDWESSVIYELSEADETGYTLSFYEKQSHEAEFGGNLFTIRTMAMNEDYTIFPNYELVENIGDYNIVILYPTDIQFSSETESAYQTLKEQVPNVVKTIKIK